jgi:hypothetical protein
MTASSLPTYPDRPRPMAPPGNNNAELLSSRRLTALGMRAVFLVGIWGMLFAFRSVLVSSQAEPPPAEEHLDSLVGTWEATDDSGFALEFTKEHNVQFRWDGEVRYRGFCRPRKPADTGVDIPDGVEIPDLVDEDGNKLPDRYTDRRSLFPVPDLEFNAAVHGDDMSIGSKQYQVVPMRNDRPIFPPLHDGTLSLKRKR